VKYLLSAIDNLTLKGNTISLRDLYSFLICLKANKLVVGESWPRPKVQRKKRKKNHSQILAIIGLGAWSMKKYGPP
jgi:hypothetical protein